MMALLVATDINRRLGAIIIEIYKVQALSW